MEQSVTREEEGMQERDREINETVAMLRSRISQLDSAFLDETEYYEATLHRLCEENGIMCTERERLIQLVNELEKKEREMICYTERLEANHQHFRDQMKKLAAGVVVGSVAVLAAVAGWWFFPLFLTPLLTPSSYHFTILEFYNPK